MQGKMFDHIQNLDKSRTNWRLKARVTRFWPTISPESSAIKGYNFIFLDDDNAHVHGYVYPDNWRSIGKEVSEGQVYIIENFQVRDTNGKLKPVSTKICIRLLNSTNIQHVPDDIMIPNHKFEFMDMGDLIEDCKGLGDKENPEFAYDVIGVVEHFRKAKRVQTRYGEREQTRFIFSDGSLKFKVTLWGDFATSVSESYKLGLDKPVIAIITSAKMSTFRDELQIGALPSTRIYFNLNIDPVDEFRQRLLEEGYKHEKGSHEFTFENPADIVIAMTTFKDLNENSVAYSLKRIVMVKFLINKVEEEDNWWYNSCISCQSEVEKLEKKFKCTDCNRSFGYCEKRFRIVVLANDATLASNVILCDRVVKRIAGTTVANILSQSKKDSSVNAATGLFASLTGREITVMLQLSDGNVTGDSNLYTAIDLCEDISSEVAIVPASPSQASSSFSMEGTVPGIELFQTPGSSQSVTKKIKAEGTPE